MSEKDLGRASGSRRTHGANMSTVKYRREVRDLDGRAELHAAGTDVMAELGQATGV